MDQFQIIVIIIFSKEFERRREQGRLKTETSKLDKTFRNFKTEVKIIAEETLLAIETQLALFWRDYLGHQ